MEIALGENVLSGCQFISIVYPPRNQRGKFIIGECSQGVDADAAGFEGRQADGRQSLTVVWQD